jgi:NAD(P)-dependent dehydrogenase (short-subunit alcohol dehydrogenase family)
MQSNIVITGASGNLGKDVVRKLSDSGYKLYVTLGPHNKVFFDELPLVNAQVVDLTDVTSSSAFATDVISKAGSVHAGVFLVGGYAPGSIEATKDE